jgi:hypothetical protein
MVDDFGRSGGQVGKVVAGRSRLLAAIIEQLLSNSFHVACEPYKKNLPFAGLRRIR